ncbi:MAG: transglutaminase-like domain-containing protein [Actinomycetota bacterium]|nr:transglutaminase-like domain-containing protein [Actinomycetota bacterium]
MEIDEVVDHARHTEYSDPGDRAGLFDDIDPTVDAVSAMARNVVAHYRAQAHELPESSQQDISLRWVAAILDTDQHRNPMPLTVERAVSNRVQGCCRDHSLLAVSALRHHGIAARDRVGFATYLSPTWNPDHVIVEAWLNGRWQRFDPEFAEPLPRLADPTDIPGGRNSPFLTAAHVWLGHRAGSVDVTRFGVGEGVGIGGDWFVFGYVIAEAAHRFGDELLLWDTWGAMSSDLNLVPPDDLALVDEVAQLLVLADEGDLRAERALLDRYHHDPRLHPGTRIRSRSPYGGVTDVDLAARTAAQASWS